MRNMVDLVTNWNLTWRGHQRELLRQLRSEPARGLWLDPPGASAGLGSAKDCELARFIVEMVQTHLDLGLYVALDATAGGHLWKLPELHAVVKHPKLRHKRYSWCSLGAKDPIARRLWHWIRRVLTNMQLAQLCSCWQDDVFRPCCCDEHHLRQPTRRRLRQNEELDRTKAARGYPDVVADAIVTDVASLQYAESTGQGNEKQDQSSSKPDVTRSVYGTSGCLPIPLGPGLKT